MIAALSLGNTLSFRPSGYIRPWSPEQRPNNLQINQSDNIQVIRFSRRAAQRAGKNLLFLTVERPYRVGGGGLGTASVLIPKGINENRSKLNGAKQDCRVLMPMLKGLEGFEYTGKFKLLPTQDGIEKFELYSKYEKENDTWVYAIKNEKYFDHQVLYFGPRTDEDGRRLPEDRPENPWPNDRIFKSIMMFCRAAAAFTPDLEGSSDQSGNRCDQKQFNGKIDAVIANDWHTGPYFSELPDADRMGKIFMLHNPYDEARPTAIARMNKLLPPDFAMTTFSPLAIGIKLANTIIGDPNYIRKLTANVTENSAQWARFLQEKVQQGRVYGVHHNTDARFDPYKTPVVQLKDGTTVEPLSKARMKADPAGEWNRYKSQYKQYIQEQFGLKVDPNANLVVFLNRLEPWQKGIFIAFDAMDKIMSKHKNTQFLIVGGRIDIPHVNAAIDARMEKLNQKFAKAGNTRFLYVGAQPPEMVSKIFAAATLGLNPMIYEPYGMVHLEEMKKFVPSAAFDTSGLSSTIYDPQYIQSDQAAERVRPSKGYGQTGFLGPEVNGAAYYPALNRLLNKFNPASPVKRLSAGQPQTLAQTADSMVQVIERALTLKQEHPEAFRAIAMNANRYASNEHSWKKLVDRYMAPVLEALKIRDAQQTEKKPSNLQVA